LTDIVVTKQGVQPTPPATLRDRLIAIVTSLSPGYTANLPGSLIEDITSTDTYALVQCDQAMVELINSVSPYAANEQLLIQLGNIYGVPQGLSTNTSVNVVFNGTPGFTILRGFTVSDGTHQYTVQSGAIIGSGGQSDFVYCLATVAGSWAVPTNTVNQIVTSVPNTVTLTVTNPIPGTPQSDPQTIADYRSQVLQGGQAVSTGLPSLMKTALQRVSGVPSRLVTIRQVIDGWQVIVGGGDPYQVANAIYETLFDLTSLRGSVLGMTAATKANPGVITVDKPHGYTTGQTVEINDVVGMVELNGNSYTATVVSPTSFSIGVDTTGFTTYVSGGVVTPNFRNQTVSITSYPNTYEIKFVRPVAQQVEIAVLWNTNSTNLVSPEAVSALAVPALEAYTLAVVVGQPMNLFQLQNVFQAAVLPILPTQLLTRIVFTVTIDGVVVPPDAGTGIIAGDSEGYFVTDVSLISVSQG